MNDTVIHAVVGSLAHIWMILWLIPQNPKVVADRAHPSSPGSANTMLKLLRNSSNATVQTHWSPSKLLRSKSNHASLDWAGTIPVHRGSFLQLTEPKASAARHQGPDSSGLFNRSQVTVVCLLSSFYGFCLFVSPEKHLSRSHRP